MKSLLYPHCLACASAVCLNGSKGGAPVSTSSPQRNQRLRLIAFRNGVRNATPVRHLLEVEVGRRRLAFPRAASQRRCAYRQARQRRQSSQSTQRFAATEPGNNDFADGGHLQRVGRLRLFSRYLLIGPTWVIIIHQNSPVARLEGHNELGSGCAAAP